ncbi:hypothetical protein ABPG74_001948 [Tetrahymena malaccensis]
MNQEKIKIEAYNEALEIVNKYKQDKKRLSLKQKALYKKSKKIIEEYEAQEAKGQQNGKKGKKDGQKDQVQDADRFNQDSNTIFDTKKGQVLFELQKSYKGDERFKLDKRFAEDIDAQKLPNTLKQLTTGIDFENLSDGSDYEFKKRQSKQKKIEKKQEKQLKKTQKLNEIEMKDQKVSSSGQASEDEGKKKQAEGQKGQQFGFGSSKNDANDANQSDSDSDFFTIKVKKDNEEEEEENNKKKSSKKKLRKSSAEESNQKLSKKKGKQNSSDEQEEDDEDDDIEELQEELQDQNDVSDSDSIQKVQFDEEDLQDDDGGKEFRKAYRIAKDYIDQEALVDEEDIQELTLEEEQHAYLKILQELMPTEKLFFQNKKKNVKVIHNKQSSYAAMLSQEEAQTVVGKKKKNKQKVEENNQEDENGENQNEESQQHNKKGKSGFDKEFNNDENDDEDQFGRQKSEKAYNLVIPRFDPSQLVVKKVMQAQENEKIQKLKEQESKKQKKKMSTEAKIEAGIDKKLQKIMKANSILDKNLTEHRKLEGVEKVQKKAPVLKKLKIDSDKWKNIINETSTNQHDTEKDNEQNNNQQIQEQKKQSSTKQFTSNNTKEQQQTKPQQFNRSQPTNHHTSLGMLFATFQPDTNQDTQRSQFKLFG